MLQDYFTGTTTPDEGDPFPELDLKIAQTGLKESLLVYKTAATADLYMLNCKALYKYCVQTLKKRQLSGKKDMCRMTVNQCGGCFINHS